MISAADVLSSSSVRSSFTPRKNGMLYLDVFVGALAMVSNPPRHGSEDVHIRSRDVSSRGTILQ